MLNPSLDPHALSLEYSRAKRIRIANVLEPAIAEAIAAEMRTTVYKLFCANGQGVAVIDLAELASWDAARRGELDATLAAAAAKADGFAYHGVRMTEAWRHGAPPTPLGRFHDALMSPAVFEAIRTITGEQTFDNAFVQATRYLPGHYLPRHLDDPRGANRKLAFVWGFTPKWDPDWGGLLQFYSDRQTPADALTPGWNTLDLFDVSHWHAVTYVAPYAQAPRLALSGWFVKGDPLASSR
jgi:SM-20-related protein